MNIVGLKIKFLLFMFFFVFFILTKENAQFEETKI